MNSASWRRLLSREVAEHYRDAGPFARHFARNKIRFDPLFADVFVPGVLPEISRNVSDAEVDFLDLGSGQALLASTFAVAELLNDQGYAPSGSQPFRMKSCHAIEYNSVDVGRARRAFASFDPERQRLYCSQSDISDASFPSANLIALIDVLHYLRPDQQEGVLCRVRAALSPRGRLLLRVGDADAVSGNARSQAIDAFVARWRGAGKAELHCRSLAQWLRLLESTGFQSRVVARKTTPFFANAMIVAELV